MHDKQSLGWVFYDGQCGFCRQIVAAIMPALRPAGFEAAPLQAPWVGARLKLSPAELLSEMRVITLDGQLLGGADAAVYLARYLPWIRPLTLLAHIPGARPLLRRGYRWVAARRRCLGDRCPPRLPSTQVKP